MARLLHREHTIADRFISHMLCATPASKRTSSIFHLQRSAAHAVAAGALRHAGQARPMVPRSPQTLADMIGTSGGRVTSFSEQVQKRGFIDYDGGNALGSTLAAQRRPARLKGTPCRRTRSWLVGLPLAGTAMAGRAAQLTCTTGMRTPSS
jgi:hypothetical protein